MPPNIYIVGAQSTGKTTLVNALSQHFSRPSNASGDLLPAVSPPAILREVARTVLKHYPIPTEDIRSSPTRSLELQRRIQHAQLLAEERALDAAAWFVADRSGVDPMTYAARYVGRDAAHAMLASDDWRQLEYRMRSGLVVVCEPGVDHWLADDGVRLMPHDRADWLATHADFCRFLDGISLPYMVLSHRVPDLDDRVAAVLDAWGEICRREAEEVE